MHVHVAAVAHETIIRIVDFRPEHVDHRPRQLVNDKPRTSSSAESNNHPFCEADCFLEECGHKDSKRMLIEDAKAYHADQEQERNEGAESAEDQNNNRALIGDTVVAQD